MITIEEELFSLQEKLSSARDQKEVTSAITRTIVEVTSFEDCVIYLWDKKNNQVRALNQFAKGVMLNDTDEIYSLEAYPTSEQVLTTGMPARVSAEMMDPENLWMLEEGWQATIFLPLIFGNETIGLVELGSPDIEFGKDPGFVKECHILVHERTEALLGSSKPLDIKEMFLELAVFLVAETKASFCMISTWAPTLRVVKTAVVYINAVWGRHPGPTYALHDWPRCAKVLHTGEYKQLKRRDPTITPEDAADLERYGIRNQLLYPIILTGTIIGLLECNHLQKEWEITKEEIELIDLILSKLVSYIHVTQA